MSNGPDRSSPGQPSPGQPPDPRRLAQDWITLWQSELSALATDREMHETVQRLVALWGAAGQALAGMLPEAGAPDGPSRGPGPAAPAGTAPAAAAPDPRDAELDRLRRRVEQLEQRIAELERRS